MPQQNQESRPTVTIQIGNVTTHFDVEDFIASESYFTARNGVANNGIDDDISGDELAELDRVACCVLTLKNGFRVIGTCITENGVEIDKEVGYQQARQDAISEAHPFICFLEQQERFEVALEEAFKEFLGQEQGA